MKSDTHIWLVHNWISSQTLPSDTECFCLASHVRLLHSSVWLEHPSPTSFKILLECNLSCEELPDSPENSKLLSCVPHSSL